MGLWSLIRPKRYQNDALLLLLSSLLTWAKVLWVVAQRAVYRPKHRIGEPPIVRQSPRNRITIYAVIDEPGVLSADPEGIPDSRYHMTAENLTAGQRYIQCDVRGWLSQT